MKLKESQFYTSDKTGIVKVLGVECGSVLLEKYDKSQFTKGPYSGWMKQNNIRADRHRLESMLLTGSLRPIPPPQ